MAKRKKRLFGIWILALLLILIVHNTFQIIVFGAGISGFSIGEFAIGEELRKNYQSLSQGSKIVLLLEWVLLFSSIIFAFVKNKIEIKKEIKNIDALDKYKKTKKSTDIDILYNILKEKKHLRLLTITKLFKVSRDTVIDWAKTLESANLATINYPKFGDPEISITE